MTGKVDRELVGLLEFDRSPQYRVINLGGAYGGYFNNNSISLFIFNDHIKIPYRTVIYKDGNGILHEESQNIQGMQERVIVREVEACLIVSKETAFSIANWLRSICEQGSGVAKTEIKSATH
jgi:hypothetical protein